MDLSVIQIGNSKGIRFSKTLIEKYNIKDTVDKLRIIKVVDKLSKSESKKVREIIKETFVD